MGDTLEAGRFLILSGTLDARYREPVELYLRRFGEQDWTHLVGTFPTAAKLPSISDYPESVSKVLRSLGGTETVNIPAALSAAKSQGITAGASRVHIRSLVPRRVPDRWSDNNRLVLDCMGVWMTDLSSQAEEATLPNTRLEQTR